MDRVFTDTLNENIMDEIFNYSPETEKSKKPSPESIHIRKYDNYYDATNTITNALSTDPLDPDNANYNQEQIHVALGRNAPVLYVSNDEAAASGHTLFVIVSHHGGQHFSRERNIEPQQEKEYYNVYELRLRSATQGAKYRVSEYKIRVV